MEIIKTIALVYVTVFGIVYLFKYGPELLKTIGAAILTFSVAIRRKCIEYLQKGKTTVEKLEEKTDSSAP